MTTPQAELCYREILWPGEGMTPLEHGLQALRQVDCGTVVGLARAQYRNARHEDGARHPKLWETMVFGMGHEHIAVCIRLVGDEDDLLALARVRDRHHHMAAVGPERLDGRLDGRQGHHLARDLGKAHCPSPD